MCIMQEHAPGLRVVVTELGEEPLEAVEKFLLVEEQPFPDEATLRSTDVVVAVRSAAVGWVDLIMASGQYQHVPEPPYTPGLEYAGEIVCKGADVDARWSLGDKVIADGFLTGPRSKGDHQKWGGFATYAVLPQEALLALPKTYSFDQGANLLGNYETAYHALIYRGRLRAGETVLIHGATGSTGLAAVHLAKLLGARVIATGRSAKKLAEVSLHGADDVIELSEDVGGIAVLRDKVKALTGGRGADVCYDAVGGELSVESLRSMAFGGRFVIVGWSGTPFVAKGKGGRGAPNANKLPTNLIMMKGLDVLGSPAVISAHNDPSLRAERLARILAWASEGRIVPHVAKAFDLSDVREAMRAKWESRYVGGVVVRLPNTDRKIG